MEDLGLKGKVAIVTGGGRGIGYCTAKKLCENDVSTIIADIDYSVAQQVESEIRANGGKAIAVKANVCSLEDVRMMVTTAISTFGKADILVNMVGGGQTKSFLDISEEEWDRMFEFNIKSAFLCCQEVLRVMVKNRSGKIVNVSSVAGRSTGVLRGAHYAASKAAVIGLTRHLAREFGPFGINTNAIAPSLTKTERITKELTSEKEAQWIGKIPLRRLSAPEDQANAVLFLVSRLSDYVNGTILDVNGGYWIG